MCHWNTVYTIVWVGGKHIVNIIRWLTMKCYSHIIDRLLWLYFIAFKDLSQYVCHPNRIISFMHFQVQIPSPSWVVSVWKVILWHERVTCISHSDWTDQTKFRRKGGQLLILSKSNLLISYFLLIFLLYSYSYNHAVCYVDFKMPCFRQKIRCDRLTVEMPLILSYNPLFSDSSFATSSVISPPPPTHPKKWCTWYYMCSYLLNDKMRLCINFEHLLLVVIITEW